MESQPLHSIGTVSNSRCTLPSLVWGLFAVVLSCAIVAGWQLIPQDSIGFLFGLCLPLTALFNGFAAFAPPLTSPFARLGFAALFTAAWIPVGYGVFVAVNPSHYFMVYMLLIGAAWLVLISTVGLPLAQLCRRRRTAKRSQAKVLPQQPDLHLDSDNPVAQQQQQQTAQGERDAPDTQTTKGKELTGPSPAAAAAAPSFIERPQHDWTVMESFKYGISIIAVYGVFAFAIWFGGVMAATPPDYLVGLCAIWPLAIGVIKFFATAVAPPGTRMYAATTSMYLAALPYRLLFLSLPEYYQLVMIYALEIVYKIAIYVVLETPRALAMRSRLRTWLLRCLGRRQSDGKPSQQQSPDTALIEDRWADALQDPLTATGLGEEATHADHYRRTSVKLMIHHALDVWLIVAVYMIVVVSDSMADDTTASTASSFSLGRLSVSTHQLATRAYE